MPLPDMDSSVGCTFGIQVDGVVIKQIQEVTGLKLEQDVIQLKQNTHDGKYVIKNLPGRQKAGEVTLTRGLTADNSFEKWIKSSRLGKMGEARKGASVIVYDFEGNMMKSYKLARAWAKSLEIGTMKAGDTSVLTEKLVVTYEEIEVE